MTVTAARPTVPERTADRPAWTRAPKQRRSPERIAEVRASVGSFVFASDYEAQFTDTTDQLFRTEDVKRAFTDDVQPLFPQGVL